MSIRTLLAAVRRRLTLVGVLVAALAVVAAGVAGPALAHSQGPSDVKPKIVLVHGAWADSGSWDGVVKRLQRQGYTVYVPPNPLRGLATDSATIADFLSTLSGPIVLVGHSYAGAVITNAATGNGNVKALVYVDAFIPDQGQSIVSLTGPPSCFAVADLSTVLDFVPYPGAPPGVVDTYVKQSVFPHCFANGLPAKEAATLAATQRPLSTQALSDQTGVPAWRTIPSWAVVGKADNVIPAPFQLAMAHHAEARVTQVNAPHLSMISDPGVVVRVINQAVRATG